MNQFITVSGSRLLIDGCDAQDLVAQYGSPLYVMSESFLKERILEIRRDFLARHPGSAAAYASKAFQTLDMLRLVASEGLHLDVVSGGELYAASKAGFPMERVFFHGNAKTRAELEMAVDLGVGRIVVDNKAELGVLDEVARARGKVAKILFRITPGVDSHTHEYISTGTLDSKFGIPLDPRVRADYVGAALRMEGVDLLGFHFHVGSQLLSNESHLKAIAIACAFMAEVKAEFGFEARDLNLGGGFGVRYTATDEPPPLSAFTDPMWAAVESECAQRGLAMPRIIIEPGRWIVGEAGVTLYTVTSIKEVPGLKTFVGIDGGMTDNPRPALYGARYEACLADKASAPPLGLVTIAGRCCESGDILIKDLALPEVSLGDILAVFTTGAYNATMASNYNRVPRPALVLAREGKSRLSVRRETYEDLLVREL